MFQSVGSTNEYKKEKTKMHTGTIIKSSKGEKNDEISLEEFCDRFKLLYKTSEVTDYKICRDADSRALNPIC